MSMQSVLQPVDINVSHSPARKRARFDNVQDENVDWQPETHTSIWSLNNKEVFLHKDFDRGVGRLDGDDQELASDDDSIFNKDGSIDVSCKSMTPITKDNQLIILETSLTKDCLNKLTTGEWEHLQIKKPVVRPSDKTNYLDMLSDEVILHILKWLPKVFLMDLSLVSKRLCRLCQDESLWTKMDVSNRHLNPGELGKVLSKQSYILRLSRTEVMSPIILPGVRAHYSDFESRLQYLDLSMAFMSTNDLKLMFSKCRRLRKLSMEHMPLDDDVIMSLSANRDIEVINFAMCEGIKQEGLEYLLTNCRRLTELNLAWTQLDMDCIRFVCKNLPNTMDRLNLSGCRKKLRDESVADLTISCPRLRELDLSDCTSITGESVKQITLLEDLNLLALSRCYLIPCKAFPQLRKLQALSFLEIHGGFIDELELRQIQTILGTHVQINKFKFSSVARPTVGNRRSSIWNLRVRD